MNKKTISAICKYYENRNGKCYLYDVNGNQLAVFEGEIQESPSSLLYVVQNGGLYNIICNEEGEYNLEKY